MPLRSKGVHCFFQQLWKCASDFHLTINTRELCVTKQLPSKYPFSVSGLKIQMCPRSCPRYLFKNSFPFFPVSGIALLVSFLIYLPFTITSYLSAVLSSEQYICTHDLQTSHSISGLFCAYRIGPFTCSSNLPLNNPLTSNPSPKTKFTLGKPNNQGSNPCFC